MPGLAQRKLGAGIVGDRIGSLKSTLLIQLTEDIGKSEVIKLKKAILNPIGIFVVGLIAGILSKIFDIYTSLLGNIFSDITVWLLIGIVISIYSDTKKKAMLNVFLFCVGMLIAYYMMAELTNSVYSWGFIYFWAAVACISPFLACIAWMAKGDGTVSKMIAVGITLVCIASGFLFQGIEIHDFLIDGILIYFLFIKEI